VYLVLHDTDCAVSSLYVDIACSLIGIVCRCSTAGPEWWGAGVVVCLEQVADLNMAQLSGTGSPG